MIIHRPRRRRIVVPSSTNQDSSANRSEPARAGGPEGPTDQWVRELKASLHEGDVSSAAIKSKMLTRMVAQSAAERPGTAGTRPPTASPARRHARRPGAAASVPRRAGVVGSTRPGQVRRTRPRLVSVGALAAVASVIGATAVIAASFHDNQPIMVNAPAGSPSPQSARTTPSSATPSPVPTPTTPTDSASTSSSSVAVLVPETALVTPSASPRPRPSNGGSPGTGGRGSDGWDGWGGQHDQASQKHAARDADLDPLPRGARLYLPGRGVTDWVVFGSARSGIISRADISFQLIDTRRLAGLGSTRGGFDTSVSWTGGTPPQRQGSRVNDRLVIPNGRSAAMTVYRGPYTGKLLVYLGGSTRISVRVSASGMQDSNYTLRLASSDSSGVITIDLGDLPDSTPATVTLTGAGDRSLSLAAAVLH
ncbi:MULTISPECIES: hypothetical protein [Pseudofrankia]|uniref:hypothetical protein n=1 Tax=Pseudofrankia TaxID=2994363 RepID=UPI000234D043|nr:MULTISPECIES: hypothetical protein [Pseudofrankia]OHV33009.1 hypothetical protein BCD49_28230 [Pseudofrankia sp. EUN1h]